MPTTSLHTALFFSLIILGSGTAMAQGQEQDQRTTGYSFEFRGETLAEALDHVAHTAEIDLVYDPQIIEGIHVYKRIRDQTVQNTLNQLLEDFRLDYLTLSSGTIVIVRSVAEAPAYGIFSGRVVDRQTGEPLPGATVMLADASGGTTTNRSGTFSMNRILPGSHTIIFSYIGYEPVYLRVDVLPDEQVQERVSLDPRPVDVAPVVVEAHRTRLPNQGNGNSMNSGREWESAGVMKDAIRNLSLMPGVQYGLPMTDLHLQGGHRGEHRILLDGVPVYNPYSFGQMFSAFSPYAIGNVYVHKAGYGVEEGSQIAGLIALNHDVFPEGENGAQLHADPLSLNGRGDLDFRFQNGSSLRLMTALRSSFWNIYQAPSLDRTLHDWDVIDPLITNMVSDLKSDASAYHPRQHESEVKFFDFHQTLRYEIDAFNSLYASFYLGENSIETHLLNQAAPGFDELPTYLYAHDKHQWQNVVGQISWNKMISPRFDLSTQASFSTNRFWHRNAVRGTNAVPGFFMGLSSGNADPSGYLNENQNNLGGIGSVLLPNQIDGNRIQHIILRTDGSYSLSPRFSIHAGLQADHVVTEVEIDDTEEAYRGVDLEAASTFFSTYLNGKTRIGENWSLTAGTRFTTVNRSSGFRLFAEPRISIQYDQPDSGIGYWSALIAGGIYRQFINQHEITNVGPTSLVPSFTIWSHAGTTANVPKAYHLSGSFLFEPSENTTLKIESFYKWQPSTLITSYYNLLVDEDGSSDNVDSDNEVSAFAETAQMTAFGMGIRFNRSLAGSRLKLMTGYDYSFARLDLSTQFGRTLPAPWNEPHRAQFRVLWRALPEVAVVTKWQGIWGRAWAFHQSYYNFLLFREIDQFGDFSFGNPENDQLSPYHQLDLSVIYQPSIGNSDLEIRLDLINLLNRKNEINRHLQPVLNHQGEVEGALIRERTMPGFYPSASVRIKF